MPLSLMTKSITAILLLFLWTTIAFSQNRSNEPIPAMPKLLSQREQMDVREAWLKKRLDVDSASFVSGVNSDGLWQEETFLSRETHRVASTVLAYPFNRAERIEMQTGVRSIGFETERLTDSFSPVTGKLVGSSSTDLPSPKALNFVEATAAFVHDTSLYGATSPILGQRYRFEVAPTLGSVNYIGALADYRLYLMPKRPFTLALRAMHYGRYGSGADDVRLQPLFIGYPNLVHGYDVNTFDITDCEALPPVGEGPNAKQPLACPVYDQLFGSRMAVANAELRFPLLGLLGGRSYYGPLPIEAAIFADTGIAWTRSESVQLLGRKGTREFLSSVGGALRMNVLGFLIAEAAYVRPLDRPSREWLWQFSLSPGF